MESPGRGGGRAGAARTVRVARRDALPAATVLRDPAAESQRDGAPAACGGR